MKRHIVLGAVATCFAATIVLACSHTEQPVMQPTNRPAYWESTVPSGPNPPHNTPLPPSAEPRADLPPAPAGQGHTDKMLWDDGTPEGVAESFKTPTDGGIEASTMPGAIP